jgi:hypothetical protein
MAPRTVEALKMNGPAPPGERPHKGVEDVRAAFANLTAKTRVDEEFRAAFLRSKVRIIET